jgi:hypothetical protein
VVILAFLERRSTIARMISRRLQLTLTSALAEGPAVVMLGSRQVVKNTLAIELAHGWPAVYLDLEWDLVTRNVSVAWTHRGASFG